MNIRDKITDYSNNRANIEHWLFVKGESNYAYFAKKLEEMNQEVNWENLSGLYRYDKRLLFNNFKYLSFFEEYLRAALIRENIGDFKKLSKKLFSKLIIEALKLNDAQQKKYFDCQNPNLFLSKLNSLRTKVCHSKIIVVGNFKESILCFYALLPANYRENYKKEIIECTKGLSVCPEISTIF